MISFSLFGTAEARAPRAAVWQRLLDPQFVAASAPGVDRVEPRGEHSFVVHSAFGVGAFSLHFTLNVELVDLRAPEHGTLRAHGEAPGSEVKVNSTIELGETDPMNTVMHWNADCEVSGALAALGGIVEPAARRVMAQFWDDFARRASLPA